MRNYATFGKQDKSIEGSFFGFYCSILIVVKYSFIGNEILYAIMLIKLTKSLKNVLFRKLRHAAHDYFVMNCFTKNVLM